MREELSRCLLEAAADVSVKGILLTGIANCFSSGAELKEIASLTASEMYLVSKARTLALVELIESVEKPIVAAVDGYALGGGCELMLACDYRIASDRAFFGFPEITLGIIPGGGSTSRLPRAVGPYRAKDLIFSGRIVKADKALEYGLVDEVVACEHLLSTARIKLKHYIKHSSHALAMAKNTINSSVNLDQVVADQREALAYSSLFDTKEQKEAMHALLAEEKE